MPMTREQILVEARRLPPDEREILIEDLRQTDDDGLSPEQLAELRRRMEAVDRGELETIPGDQVMQEVLQSLRRRR